MKNSPKLNFFKVIRFIFLIIMSAQDNSKIYFFYGAKE